MNLWRELYHILWHRTPQHNAYITGALAWLVSALGFFLVVVNDEGITAYFHNQHAVLLAGFATLFTRLVGALVFGLLAERGNRRLLLLFIIAFCSITQILSGLVPLLAPNLILFLVLRLLFGLGMGGAWTVGAIVTMDWFKARKGDLQPKWMPQLGDRPGPENYGRGLISGIFQQGYVGGYFVAALLVGGLAFVHPADSSHTGWTQLFMFAGVLGLLSVVGCLVWLPFGETAVWVERRQADGQALGRAQEQPDPPEGGRSSRVRPSTARVFAYATLLMIAFLWMAHASQDLYPVFLRRQIGLSPVATQILVLMYTGGAFIGGSIFGYHSDRFGRRRCILATVLIGALLVPLWVGLFPWGVSTLGAAQKTDTLLSPAGLLLVIGAVLMQFMLQGAFGVMPAHLYELFQLDKRNSTLSFRTPRGMFPRGMFPRGMLPALFYHLGVLASSVAPFTVAGVAGAFGASGHANYALGQAIVLWAVFALMVVATLICPDTGEATTPAPKPAAETPAQLQPVRSGLRSTDGPRGR
jgi:SHS family lactate transporter-like MFS transporter